MTDLWPAYYTRLGAFRGLFATGSPILTYHKFGARPRRARLRGLYLEGALLNRQLEEWRAAGMSTVGVAEVLTSRPGEAVALTIDDGFRSVLDVALPLLKRWGATATLYVVVDRLGGWNDWETAQGELPAPLMDEAGLREWVAAGQRVGAHTLTHPWLTRIPAARAKEEIGASRRKLEDRLGQAVTDFCYPYGDWNPAIRDWVIEAGYRTATTTDFGVNTGATSRFELRRITARHPSWSWKAVRAWWRRWRLSGVNRNRGQGGAGGRGSMGSSPTSDSQRG